MQNHKIVNNNSIKWRLTIATVAIKVVASYQKCFKQKIWLIKPALAVRLLFTSKNFIVTPVKQALKYASGTMRIIQTLYMQKLYGNIKIMFQSQKKQWSTKSKYVVSSKHAALTI